MKIDKEKFAQAVLFSNKESLDLEKQLELYVEAVKLADKHNRELPVPIAKVRRSNRQGTF